MDTSDNTSEIRITVPECCNEITALIRPDPVAINDFLWGEDNHQQIMQSKQMHSSDVDGLSGSSSEKKDTISDIYRNPAANINYFSFSDNHFKKTRL